MTAVNHLDLATRPSPAIADPVSRRTLILWAILITLAYLLLWSPRWYPLSDSSLYLSLGRSIAQGRGLTMMGDKVKLVPPLTPALLGLLMKVGAGIGAIQAVMIALTLIAHGLSFLTLRRWLRSERLALGATIACALSYWVFANAFAIMSEPLCIALMWGGLLALSHADNEHRHGWALVAGSCILLLGAAANRDAVLCILPGPILWLLVKCRWSQKSIIWGAIFFAVFSTWFYLRFEPRFIRRMLGITPAVAPTTQPVIVNPELEPDADSNLREGRYRASSTFWPGVPSDLRHRLTRTPVLGGRWVAEGMVMASVGVFESKSEWLKVLGTTAAFIAFTLVIVGGVRMLIEDHWWVLGTAMYFAVIWIEWGVRIKPRYMIPIAPVLVLCLWFGLTWAIAQVALMCRAGSWNAPRAGRATMAALVGVIAVGNAFPWLAEFYIRHVSGRDFYDVARRGAYAQLVDIGAYVQKNVAPEQIIWTNAGAHRRIAYFLCGRKIETSELPIADWKDFDLLVAENGAKPAAAPSTGPSTRPSTLPATIPSASPGTKPSGPATAPSTQPAPRRRGLPLRERRKRFLNDIPPSASYLLILVEHPTPNHNWPAWHWPTRPEDRDAQWWRLYQRQPDNSWKRIDPARARDYVQSIPAASR